MLLAAALAAGGGLLAAPARAAGTAAGTGIGNSATLSYTIPGRRPSAITATAVPVVVARVISVAVGWQDSTAIPTRSPDVGRALTFVVTNTGNGPETFRLSRTDVLEGDQFDPVGLATGSIWLESGAEPGLQASGPAADIAYVPGRNDPRLAADASRIAYLLSNIPAGVATGAQGRAMLRATAATPGAASAAAGASLGTFDGVEAVAGRTAEGRDFGAYLVAGVALGIAKTVATVADPAGGSRVMSGSVLTYRLRLTLTGSGLAEAVAVQDPLPDTVRYVAGSLTVDGAARTDAEDADGVAFSGNTVRAALGDVPAPGTRVIEFKATVN